MYQSNANELDGICRSKRNCRGKPYVGAALIGGPARDRGAICDSPRPAEIDRSGLAGNEKQKALCLRANKIHPMGTSGMRVTFLDPSTMVFDTKEAVKSALDARDG